MLICFGSAKFLLKGVNIVSFSNNHNIVSSLICGGQNKLPMEFLDPFLQSLYGRGSGWGGGESGIHYSFKIQPIIHLIKILGYLLN